MPDVDPFKTQLVPLEGGLILNEPALLQGINKPGSLIRSINYEPSQEGGYRRLSGFEKYSSTALSGSGAILGAFVFNNGVVSMRGTAVYFGSGGAWSAINGADTRTAALKYRCAKYNFTGTSVITCVDSVNYPFKYDGSTYTVLSAAPQGAVAIASLHNYLFLAKGRVLTFSVPNDDADYTAGNGAGSINLGFTITQIFPFRDELYVFGKSQIAKITGNTKTTFAVEPVTSNLGCVAPDSVQEIGGDLFFLSPDGIRTIAATERIGDIEIGSVSRPIQKKLKGLAATYASGTISSCIVFGKSQYRLFAASSASSESAAQGFLGGVRLLSDGNLKWEWHELQGIKVACADSGFVNDVELVVHGAWDGYIYKQESGYSFNSANVESLLQTPYMPLDDPAVRKILHAFEAYIEAEGASDLTLLYYLDYNDPNVIQPASRTLASGSTTSVNYDDPPAIYDDTPNYDLYDTLFHPVFRVPIEGGAFSVSFVISALDTNPSHIVKSALLEYELADRRG